MRTELLATSEVEWTVQEPHCSLYLVRLAKAVLTKPTVSCTSYTGGHPVLPTPLLVQILYPTVIKNT